MKNVQIPCPDPQHLGEFACPDKSKCWEKCGDLGKAKSSDEQAINDGLEKQ